MSTELYERDLKELGIDVPEHISAAYRVDEDTIKVVVYDTDGGMTVDDPSKDESGEDAWEWIAFDNGRQRDAWIDEHDDWDNGNNIWIERYEHSMVRYAPIGEASQVDRQWDVAQGVAVIVFTKPESFGNPLLEVARCICEEYTHWCNGNVYGIITFQRRPALDAPHSPVLIPDEFATETWHETDACWGFLGDEHAETCAKEGCY